MVQTSITTWLEQEQPPDFYRLLGRPRLDPDIEGLARALKAAFCELMPYQNHADPAKARRAMSLLTELGRVESLLANAARLAEANQRLVAELSAQCAERFAADGPDWKEQEVRAWLERDEQISSAALEQTLAAVCAALPSPPAVLELMPVSLDLLDAFDTAAGADEHVDLPAEPSLPNIIMDDDPPADAAVHTVPCPHCSTRAAANAAICVQCGYDFRSGQRLTTKTGRKEEPARPTRVRPPPPPRNLLAAAAAKPSKSARPIGPWAVATVCVVVFLILAGGLGTLALRVSQSDGSTDQTQAVQKASRKDPARDGAKQPTNNAPESPLTKDTFDATFRRAVTAAPQDFDELWATALRLAPDLASRQRVHQTKIAALSQRPLPWPAETLEKLCAAYDLAFADAQSVGDKLTITNSLLFILTQKKALEAALARYVALDSVAADKPLRETIVQRLTQACLSSVSSLPVGERLAACTHLVSLTGGDEATRLASYRLLAGDPAVLSQAPLEKLWEIFDVVLDVPANGPAASYLPILLAQVQRRSIQSEATEHYEEMAREGPNRALGQRVLDALAEMALAQNRPPFPVVPPTPDTMGPGMPPARRRAPAMPAPPPTRPAPSRQQDEKLAEYQRFLSNSSLHEKTKDTELEEMFNYIVEKTGQTQDATQVARQLVNVLAGKRTISYSIERYKERLKKDPNDLPALYFLATAYDWRSKAKRANTQRDSIESESLRKRLQKLAPTLRGRE